MASFVGQIRRFEDQNDWEKTTAELEQNGYAVVRGVMTEHECAECVAQYRVWLVQFENSKVELYHKHSLVQRYSIGHLEPTWTARLKAKPVFAKLWGTEKLLSSFDGVAIGKPPEEEEANVVNPEEKWLHLDQGNMRRGLHAYQGAVYLEETTRADWVFRVLAGSHKYHEDFMNLNPDSSRKSKDFYKLSEAEIKWYEDKGCKLTPVPVPKGGMVLWDSRTVHDSRRPEHGRPNANRWRFVVFVSMTPAIWANSKDLQDRRTAYRRLLLTTHWSSQGTKFFPEKQCGEGVKTVDTLPKNACTYEAKLFAAIKEYDFKDGEPNGDDMIPTWTKGDYSTKPKQRGKRLS